MIWEHSSSALSLCVISGYQIPVCCLLFLIAIRKAIQEIYDIDQTVIKWHF